MSERVNSIAIVVSSADRGLGDFLLLELNDAQLGVIENPGVFAGESAVVLISPSAVHDPEWQKAVGAVLSARLIPVRVGAVEPGELPPELRDVQWEQFIEGRERELLGALLIAVSIGADDRRRLRKLESGAVGWATTGRRATLLLDDRAQLRESYQIVQRYSGTLAHDVQHVVHAFLVRSERRVRNRRWVRRVRWMVGVAALLAACVMWIAVLPRLREIAGTTTSNLVLVPQRTVERDLPQWSTLMAAAGLLQGTEQQELLSRQRLVVGLALPAPLGEVNMPSRFAIEALVPMETRPSLVAVVRNGDAYSLLVQSSIDASIELLAPLPGEFWFVDIEDDERTAVAVGGDGVVTVDIESGEVRPRSGDRFDRVVAIEGVAFLGSFEGRIAKMDLEANELIDIAEVGALRSFGPVMDGAETVGAVAVGTVDGEYRLVDVESGDVLASAVAPTETEPLAAVFGRDSMVVVDDDRRVWRLSSDGARLSTGIVVPFGTIGLEGIPGGRLAIIANEQAVRVIDLATSATLGTPCSPGLQTLVLTVGTSGERLGCLAGRHAGVWPSPAGPSVDAVSDVVSWSESHVAVVDGARVSQRSGRPVFSVLAVGEVEVDTGGAAFISSISASGEDAVIGTVAGEVVVVTAHESGQMLRTGWTVPDGASVAAVAWSDRGPLVRTVNGKVWTVPWCGGCTTDADLLDRLSEQLVPCWAERQLEFVSRSTQRRLGITVCDVESLISVS